MAPQTPADPLLPSHEIATAGAPQTGRRARRVTRFQSRDMRWRQSHGTRRPSTGLLAGKNRKKLLYT